MPVAVRSEDFILKSTSENKIKVKHSNVFTNMPLLVSLPTEIWQALCVNRFGVRTDSEDFVRPKSWRKLYHVCTTLDSACILGLKPNLQTKYNEEKTLEEDAATRLRHKYQALAADKQQHTLKFTEAGPPRKRPRINGCT
jgi:hypothetical protein